MDVVFFFFSSRRRHTRFDCDWSSDVCSSDLLNSLLDEIFNRYVAQVAEARRKPVEDVRALVDAAPHNARAAHEAGLIDGALYREEVEAELKKRLGYKDDEKLRKVSMAEYRRS